MDLIRSMGYEPVLGRYAMGAHHQFSGTDAERLADMQWALDDNAIQAVISLRGGYGCLRLVDQLDFTALQNNPKWIVGYSDVTVFHAHLLQNLNMASLHATMPVNFTKHAQATQSLFDALAGKDLEYAFEGNWVNGPHAVSGMVVGGNLSLLYALNGSASAIDTKDKILFIEDLDEYLYHIDRMMLSLKRAGKLSGLKALVVGGFTDMRDNAVPYGKTAQEIILEAVAEYNYPVVFNFPAGHQDENMAIKLGCMAQLKTEGQRIIFTQPA